MTAPDHMPEMFEDRLHEPGHPANPVPFRSSREGEFSGRRFERSMKSVVGSHQWNVCRRILVLSFARPSIYFTAPALVEHAAVLPSNLESQHRLFGV